MSNLVVKLMNVGNEVGELYKSVAEIIENFEKNQEKAGIFKETVILIFFLFYEGSSAF